MAIVHLDWYTRRYHANTCSLAFCFHLIMTLATLIAPYFIAHGTQSFWLKTNDYKIQPSLQFRHDIIATTEGQEPGEGLAFSTVREIRELIGDVRVPVVKARPEDFDNDGIVDIFHLSVKFPLRNGETVTTARLLARFQIQFEKPYRMNMDGMAILQHEARLPGSEVHFDADLEYQARKPYVYKTKLDREGDNIFNTTNLFSLDEVSFPQLISTYRGRNESIVVTNNVPLWVPGQTNSFTMYAKLRVHEQQIEYIPGVWEVLKFAWIQYFAIYFIIYGLASALRGFVFSQQVVETTVVGEVGPKLKRF